MNSDSASRPAAPTRTAPLPAAFTAILAPWIEAADGDQELALVLLHEELRSRLREPEGRTSMPEEALRPRAGDTVGDPGRASAQSSGSSLAGSIAG